MQVFLLRCFWLIDAFLRPSLQKYAGTRRFAGLRHSPCDLRRTGQDARWCCRLPAWPTILKTRADALVCSSSPGRVGTAGRYLSGGVPTRFRAATGASSAAIMGLHCPSHSGESADFSSAALDRGMTLLRRAIRPAQVLANQLNVISFGFTTRNNRSTNNRLTT